MSTFKPVILWSWDFVNVNSTNVDIYFILVGFSWSICMYTMYEQGEKDIKDEQMQCLWVNLLIQI